MEIDTAVATSAEGVRYLEWSTICNGCGEVVTAAVGEVTVAEALAAGDPFTPEALLDALLRTHHHGR